jgi:hypothetical protein
MKVIGKKGLHPCLVLVFSGFIVLPFCLLFSLSSCSFCVCLTFNFFFFELGPLVPPLQL